MPAVNLPALTDAAAKTLGGGVGLFGVLRFVQWSVDFFFKRVDTRQHRLDARERILEARFDLRLKHVEAELAKYREATMLLVNRLASKNPTDPALQEVAKILREVTPIPDVSAELDALLQEAASAVERQK